MSLTSILSEKRTAIISAWFRGVCETYPGETARFLQAEKDRFANPVGSTIRRSLEGIFGELTGERDRGRLGAAIDEAVRIRAVQEFPPSDAVGFMFLLKDAVRGVCDEEQVRRCAGELREFEQWVDAASLLAFDIYTACREKIHEIQVREVRSGMIPACGGRRTSETT